MVPMKPHPYRGARKFLQRLSRHRRKWSLSCRCSNTSSHASLGQHTLRNVQTFTAWSFACVYDPPRKRHVGLFGHDRLIESNASHHSAGPRMRGFSTLTLHSGHVLFFFCHAVMHEWQKLRRHSHSSIAGVCIIC